MNLSEITPVVLTLNERANIGRSLECLRWADRILVVDSGSDDGTREIVRRFDNADLIVREFDTHAGQWNYAISLVRTQWALALDADYLVPRSLMDEVAQLPDDARMAGYQAPFEFHVFGRSLRASLYPPRLVLLRMGSALFFQEGHTQREQLTGLQGVLKTAIVHDDRKPLERWFRDQLRYSRLEADYLSVTPARDMGIADRLRASPGLAPALMPLYCLLFRRLLFDGWAGVYYTAQRTTAELMLALMLMDRRLRRIGEV